MKTTITIDSKDNIVVESDHSYFGILVVDAIRKTFDEYALSISEAIIVHLCPSIKEMPSDKMIEDIRKRAEREVVKIVKSFYKGEPLDISDSPIKREFFLAVHRRCIEIVEKGE